MTRSEQSGLIIDSIFGALILGANSIVSAFDDEASGAGIAAGILDPMPDLVSFLRLPYLVEMGGETQAIKIALDVLCGCAAGACTIADALDA